MRSLLQSVGAIVASLMAAMLLVILVEVVTLHFHPFPDGSDPNDQQFIVEHVAKFPAWVLALAVVGWAVTTFVAAWIATRLGSARHPAHGIAVGLLLFAAAAFNMYLLPYPVWFEAGNYLLLPLAIFAAVRLGRETATTS